MPDQCVFCRIVSGAAEASVVLDERDVLGFLDVSPATRGHILVVPKRHVAELAALDPATGAAMFEAGRRLVAAVRAALGCPGVNLFVADGEAAGQEVFHVHLHVLPRYAGDGFGVQAKFRSPSRAELDDAASVVRRALG